MRKPTIHGDLTLTWNVKCSCYTLNLPARLSCPGVQERMKDPKAICNFCYAWSSNFRLPNSARILKANFKYIMAYNWRAIADALLRAIDSIPRKDRGYFRFFASGDIPNQAFATSILYVARHNPKTWFWLPTQNRRAYDEILYGHRLKNLAVRFSTLRINDSAPYGGSMVYTGKPPERHHVCKGKCIDCRECWLNPKIRIAYKFHGSACTKNIFHKAKRVGGWR